MIRLTQKQETFCLKYFELGNASEAARLAKYSPHTAAVIGRENLLKPKIRVRIDELRQEAKDATVATVLERKQVLTEITRGRIGNLLDDNQRFKQRIPLTDASIQEVDTFEIKIGKGGNAPRAQITKIKLHNPIQAIDLLNKMDKLYTDGASVNIDNRTLVINVASEEAKSLTERLIENERA